MIHQTLLTFFGCGKAKKAQGTWGSLAALFLWLGVTKIFVNLQITVFWQTIFWSIFLTSILIYGTFAIPIYAKFLQKNSTIQGKKGFIDHPTIVLDEVLGQVFALHFSFFLIDENYFANHKLLIFHLFLSFALFRFFDITKPSIIGMIDKKMKTGFGVMFDDLVCGILSALIVGIIVVLF